MPMIGKDKNPARLLNLYFHIPFCRRKCDYCHFYVIPDEEKAKERLLEGFKAEITLLSPLLAEGAIATLYFGGGTPSLFGPGRLASIIATVKETCPLLPSAEITLEANPENVTAEAMKRYADAGVNRVSIGIQTLDPDLLTLLGRLHSPETARQAILTTFRAGIDNISVDLMYDLPKQSLAHWTHTLSQLELLPLKHLSLYNLTFEPHTPFFKKQHQLRQWLPDEEASLAMYETAVEYLATLGLGQYEISAFAHPGYESQHNKGYWTGRPFLGLGPSAFSYWEGTRSRNIAHLNRYCRLLEAGIRPTDFEERLAPDAKRRELLVLRLRLCEGVQVDDFVKSHGPLEASTHTEISRLKQEAFLQENEGRIRLTKKGILFYDTLAASLI